MIGTGERPYRAMVVATQWQPIESQRVPGKTSQNQVGDFSWVPARRTPIVYGEQYWGGAATPPYRSLGPGSGQIHKVLQQLQSDLLAFFRMELGGVDVVAPDGGGEIVAVLGPGGDDGVIHGLRVEAVDVIDVAAGSDAAVQGAIGAGDLEAVPADLRDLEPGAFGEADDAALEYAEAGGAGIEFLTILKQRLVADADAEEGFAGTDEIARGFKQFLFAEGIDAIVEGADAGEHKAGGIADLAGMLHEADGSADLEQRFVDAAQVSGAVIKQGKHDDSLSQGSAAGKEGMKPRIPQARDEWKMNDKTFNHPAGAGDTDGHRCGSLTAANEGTRILNFEPTWA